MIRFFVPGRPAPGGSKKAFVNKKTGRANVVDAGKGNKEWRATVAKAAADAYKGPLLTGALWVEFDFVIDRPWGHFGRAGTLLPSAPRHPTKKPDVTKLVRATEDALTGVLWKDDAQIVLQHASKSYGDRPGVHVKVRVMK